jgi:hypothetical protein
MEKIRLQLLTQVKVEITNLIDKSLHQTVITTLGSQEESAILSRIWELQFKLGNNPSVNLPQDTKIIDIFTQTQGKLLILGAVGAGKTTTMLQLCLELINNAVENSGNPVPVIFNLLNWKKAKKGLSHWIIYELTNKYHLSINDAKALVFDHKLIFCFDNLDDLDLPNQQLCIQSLNQLFKGNIIQKIAICSQLEAYTKCNTKLKVSGAVFLRPLNEKQIKQYLLDARSRMLWEVIKEDNDILKIAEFPLFLSMMTLAFEEILIHGWRRIREDEERKKYLLNAYIRWCLMIDIENKFYAKNQEPLPEKTRFWLINLAKQMERMGLSELDINKIDESWLENKRQFQLYNLILWLWVGIIVIIAGVVNFFLLHNLLFSPLFFAMIIVVVWFFGFKTMQKLSIFLVLWYDGIIPFNYRRFLDYASAKLLLQKVGNNYQFLHLIIQKHFAQM